MTSPTNGAEVAWTLRSVATREELTDPTIGGAARDFWLLEHDPHWLANRLRGDDKTVLLVLKDGERFCGLFVHDVGLDLGLGELSLGAIPVRRHVLTGGLSEKAATASELVTLLDLLADEMRSKGVLFLQGVRDDEPLRVAIDDPAVRRRYLVLPHGPAYQRCRIILDGSYEAYLASLKSKIRTDLRRTVRHFTAQFGSGIQYQVVRTEQDLDAVLPELESLSAGTYQAKMLGLGVTRGSLIEQQLRFGTRQGLARLDLLRVDGKLVSFSIGYVHGETLYGMHRGYDAEIAEWSPGIAHNSFILEDLYRSVPPVRIFDMMYGESVYKAKLSNSFHPEQHFYLIPWTPRGIATWLALRAVDEASRAAGALAAKLQHKATVIRFIRRLAGRSPSD